MSAAITPDAARKAKSALSRRQRERGSSTMGVSRSAAPVPQRRKIGRILKELRETSGMTIEDAGAAIGCSDSTISRVETGKRDARIIEIKGLCEAYGAPDDKVAELLGMARQAPAGGLWTAHEAAFPPSLETYLGLEEAARSLRVFALASVHSLVRTRATTRAILRAGLPTAGEDEIDLLADAHMARQSVLLREPVPAELEVVLDEAALHRPAGGREALIEQLDHLVHCAENVPNITLQVLPYSKGAHGSPNGGFTLIDFPDPEEPQVVYCDTPGGNLYLQKPHDTRRFNQLYGRLCGAALDPTDSIKFLRALRQEM
ncbi:helix-turn-helix domain-containing protein [Kitasatospora sp. NPDC101801]|uniref:helix-turn-helix domain-containing protein n=1 Tax=Kitasatospora sp. NPDC101801 TaxID=3364103 RepID=UPI0038102BAA